jgi:peptidoglycan/xylan/chitin deacetylase (PgdA/CDA1 family)
MMEPIPVLMYHSVAPQITDWAFSGLSLEPDVFEDQISTLSSSGYTSVTLAELHDYVSGKGRLPPKAIVLTFDDGYVDNWVFAFPILRKHGFRATVFISTDFIDRRNVVRPTLDDVWQARCKREDLTWRGFLCEGELRRLLSSELVDIQAHSKTHTWYFISRRIVDFHHPGDRFPWLAWNERPDRKYLYMEEDQSQFVPFGSPVYEHAPSAIARRYFPDPAVGAKLAAYAQDRGGARFFERPDWRDRLRRFSDQIASGASGERVESQEERLTRLRDEIVLSKQELETIIGREVRFLCWPGGAYDKTSVEIAGEAGFAAWTLGSRTEVARMNLPGEDPAWIRRTAVVPRWTYRGREVCPVDGRFLKYMIEKYKGARLSGLRLKWYKAGRLLASYLR